MNFVKQKKIWSLPMETKPEAIPTMMTLERLMYRCRRSCRTRGTRYRATSARNTTATKVSKEMAMDICHCIGFGALEGRSRSQKAILAVRAFQQCVGDGVVRDIPGRSANMFGRVLPIQKGRWNWVTVKSVKKTPARAPKRRDTARRRRDRPNAFKLERTRRTVYGVVR